MPAAALEQRAAGSSSDGKESNDIGPDALVGDYTYDLSSGDIHWSPELRAIHGISDEEPLDTERIVSLIHPEDRDRFREHIARAVRRPEGARYEGEFRILRTAPEEIRWVRDTGRVLFQGEGRSRRAVRASGIVVDITAQKRVEEQLRRTNERFRATLNSSQVNVFTQDLELRYNWIYNPAPSFRPEDMVGKRDEDLVAVEEARPLTEIKREVLATGVAQRSEVRLTIAGELRWYDLSVQAERDLDGRIIGVLGTAVDITRQKHAEEILCQRSERLILLFEAARGLLATSDPLVFVEQLFAKLAVAFDLHVYAHYAVSADGTHLRLAASGGLTPKLREAMARLEFDQPPCGVVARTAGPIVVPGHGASDQVTSAVRSLGLAAYICHPLIARGELFGTLAFGSMNDLEHTEESVALFRAVSDLVALAIARHRAEESLLEADRRKDEFLATLAHELRNPLAPIRSGLDIMRLAPDDLATIETTRGVLERQAQQLTRLVDDLLEVSRITQGKLELRKAPVKLTEIVESALEQTRSLIDDAGHELTIDLPAEPVVLEGDAVRLAQVLANLLSNAAKYTPERGHIELTAEKAADSASISVRDDGFGIPAEKLRHVFEMFEQIDHSSTRGYKGLGLGLTLVKSLAEMHGGTVEARSEGLGKGSEFTVRLPIATGAEIDEPRAVEAEPAAASTGAIDPPRRVLIVDDNEDATRTLARLVEMLGHETRVAFDGQEALRVTADFRPHLVLLDIGMPRMTGYEVARRIRGQPWGRDVVLVAVTGWGQENDRQRAAEAGFDRHLAKPVGESALRTLLRAGRTRPPSGARSSMNGADS